MNVNIAPYPNTNLNRNIKVMIIDDSAIIRGLVSKWLEAEKDIELVGVAINGQDGINRVAKFNPDIIILDIEMPQMDGITALPLLLEAVPGVKVIMASTLTKAGAEVTIKALTLGATDYIAKPDASRIAGAEEYKQELIAKLHGLGKRRAFARPSPTLGARPTNNNAPAIAPTNKNVVLRPFVKRARPEILVIGSSTGGPEALRNVVSDLAGKIHVPVLITQHMPVLFTKILAEHLSKQCNCKVIEAEHDMQPVPGCFYIAPGGKHMVINRSSSGMRLQLNENPPENFCRPSVDPMFRSVANLYGDRALAVILTGMGHDGREGAKMMLDRGANLIVQDEATSVVWGMPGSAAMAGLACAVKPINQIANSIINVFQGVAP